MALLNPYNSLCAVGFLARFSYALARTPVLPLFALYLGAGPEAIGFIVGISTVTGIFFKLPSGALSDLIGRQKTLLAGLVVFAVMPFTYLLVGTYQQLILIRFLHGFATAIYGPVAMAVVMDAAGGRKGEMLSWFSSVTIIGNLVGAPVGGFILYRLATSSPTLFDFQVVYLVSGVAGLLSLLLALIALRGQETVGRSKGLRESLRRFRLRDQGSSQRPAGGGHLSHGGPPEHEGGGPGSLSAHLCREGGGTERVPGGSPLGGPGVGDHPVQTHHGPDFRPATGAAP